METYQSPAVLGSFEAKSLMGEALGGPTTGSCEYPWL